MKNYNVAPLPFVGQKRNFIRSFKQELSRHKAPIIYVDLFGGSGLLSRAAKDVHPTSIVVYNDYDNYRKRLAAIPRTNAILNDIRPLVDHVPTKTKIGVDIKQLIIDRIAQEKGYVDYITLSASLLFSMKYVLSLDELKKETMYNRVRKSPLIPADDYLLGLEIVSCDYKELFKKYKNQKNVVYLIDPPYLSTDCSTYKSSIVELCEWIGDNTSTANPFKNATIKTHFATMNQSSSYTDMMLFKWTQTTT